MSDDKDAQVKQMAAVLAGMIPPAARISIQWAQQLYEHGMRIHPDLVEQPATKTAMQEAYTPELQEESMRQAMATLREMAGQFPYLQPLVDKIENARTPQERAAAAIELRKKIPDELIAQAQAGVEQLNDSTE